MSASIGDAADLFLRQLGTMLWIENQLATIVLPRLRERAHAVDLAAALDRHLLETDDHVARLRTAFSRLREAEAPVESSALHGLLADDASTQLGLADGEGALADLATIETVLRVEHLELAGYDALVHAALALELAEDIPHLLRLSMGEDAFALEQAEFALVKLLAEKVATA